MKREIPGLEEFKSVQNKNIFGVTLLFLGENFRVPLTKDRWQKCLGYWTVIFTTEDSVKQKLVTEKPRVLDRDI